MPRIMTERKHVTARTFATEMPFSDAVLAGDTLYVSGNIGLDPATRKPPATVEHEARLVLASLKRAVEAAGMSLADMVQVQVFCSDVSCFDDFNLVYKTFFREPYPARAFLGSGPLLFGARFEVMGIAVRR